LALAGADSRPAVLHAHLAVIGVPLHSYPVADCPENMDFITGLHAAAI
jgi:hypothetical protein